jgi:hypothetical protein
VPYTYSLDAIQEFQVSASNYSAEFGQAAGPGLPQLRQTGCTARGSCNFPPNWCFEEFFPWIRRLPARAVTYSYWGNHRQNRDR